MLPKVTVAIPTRNRKDYLRIAVNSVLTNGYNNFELIVSDNASVDDTSSLIRLFPHPEVRWFSQKADLGMAGNWNFCLQQATGQYFLLLSDDDQLLPGAINALIQHLDGAAFVYGRVRIIDSKGTPLTCSHSAPASENYSNFLDAWLTSKRSIYPCALLAQTDSLLHAGGYAPRYGTLADVGSWLALLRYASDKRVAFVDQTIADYRSHQGSLSTHHALAEELRCFENMVSEFADLFSASPRSSVARMRNSLVASKLRLLAKARSPTHPFLQFIRELVRHHPFITSDACFEPYLRNALILLSPSLYEVYKRRRGH